jgi:hypothetical protein
MAPRRRVRRRRWPECTPPAAIVSPLMATLRGEARKVTTWASSAAVTGRPMLMSLPSIARAAASVMPRAEA